MGDEKSIPEIDQRLKERPGEKKAACTERQV